METLRACVGPRGVKNRPAPSSRDSRTVSRALRNGSAFVALFVGAIQLTRNDRGSCIGARSRVRPARPGPVQTRCAHMSLSRASNGATGGARRAWRHARSARPGQAPGTGALRETGQSLQTVVSGKSMDIIYQLLRRQKEIYRRAEAQAPLCYKPRVECLVYTSKNCSRLATATLDYAARVVNVRNSVWPPCAR